MPAPTIVWFRQDLRLRDHQALTAAVARGGPVLPVYTWAPEEEGAWPPGAASRWWLHHSLASLDASLQRRGSRLLIRRGPSLATLRDLVRESGAGAVTWSRRYEPASVARDAEIKSALRADGVEAESFESALLVEPWEIRTREGQPYKVFTPFWRALAGGPPPGQPQPAPARVPPPRAWPSSLTLEDLRLLPEIPWDAGFRKAWQPGEDGAHAALESFLDDGVDRYDGARDAMARQGTSRLSPHLHFGEISPREAWALRLDAAGRRANAATDPWLRQIAWREFAHHLLFHYPRTTEHPLRADFERFPFLEDAPGLRAWQRGRTGYPIVDAGMRELWATGWMHNRARMVVASFLVKHLLLPWQDGASWFWDTLVDADLANNTLGWQWVAGSGADAAPYFRIFNPVTQGEKFDASGDYVRRWVPEIARLPDRFLHAPWTAPPIALHEAGVERDRTYPAPIVEHGEARARALAALRTLSERSSR